MATPRPPITPHTASGSLQGIYGLSPSTLALFTLGILAISAISCAWSSGSTPRTVLDHGASKCGTGFLPMVLDMFHWSGVPEDCWNWQAMNLFESAPPHQSYRHINIEDVRNRRFPGHARFSGWGYLQKFIWLDQGLGQEGLGQDGGFTDIIRDDTMSQRTVVDITNAWRLPIPNPDRLIMIYGAHYIDIPVAHGDGDGSAVFDRQRRYRLLHDSRALILISAGLVLRFPVFCALVPASLLLVLVIIHNAGWGGEIQEEDRALFNMICNNAPGLEKIARVFASRRGNPGLNDLLVPPVRRRPIDVIIVSSGSAVWCRCDTRITQGGRTYLLPFIPTTKPYLQFAIHVIHIAVTTVLPWGYINPFSVAMFGVMSDVLASVWIGLSPAGVVAGFFCKVFEDLVYGPQPWCTAGDVWLGGWYTMLFIHTSGVTLSKDVLTNASSKVWLLLCKVIGIDCS